MYKDRTNHGIDGFLQGWGVFHFFSFFLFLSFLGIFFSLPSTQFSGFTALCISIGARFYSLFYYGMGVSFLSASLFFVFHHIKMGSCSVQRGPKAGVFLIFILLYLFLGSKFLFLL